MALTKFRAKAVFTDTSTDALIEGEVLIVPFIEGGGIVQSAERGIIPTGVLGYIVTNPAAPEAGGVLREGPLVTDVAGVELIAHTSELLLDTPLQYRVVPRRIKVNGRGAKISEYTFEAPTTSVDVDLIEVARVAGVPGLGTSRGPRGYRTRAIPITSGPNAGKAQWVDELDQPVGAPVTWDQVVSQAIFTAAAQAKITELMNATNMAAFNAMSTSGNGYAKRVGGAWSPVLPLPIADLDSAVVSLTGTQTLTNKTLTTPIIDTIRGLLNSTPVATFQTVSNAVNYLNFQNRAAGQTPRIQAVGSDTDVGIVLEPKGAGAVTINNLSASNAYFVSPRFLHGLFDATGTPVLGLSTVANQVNYFQLSPSIAGANTRLNIYGADTNVGLDIVPKGDGRVSVTNLTAPSAVLASPRISNFITDANGASALQIAATASAVNYFIMTNGAANGPVWLRSAGADPNVSMYLWPKGSGNVFVWGETGQTPTIQATGADGTHQLHLQTKNAGSIVLKDGNGAYMLTASSVGSQGVSYLDVSNGTAAGGGVTVFTRSTQATAGMFFRSKGNGTYLFGNEANETSLRIGTLSGSVNYLSVSGSATGGAIQLTAFGTDTDVGVAITPKGAGRATVTNLTASNANLSTPLITGGALKDPNGNIVFGLNSVSSATNYVYVNSATDGGQLTLGAWGTNDANVSMQIIPKGTGRVTVTSLNTTSPRITSAIMDLNGNTILSLNPQANPVNYLHFANSAAGNFPDISSQGADANIGIQFRPKGSGNILIAAATGQTPTIQATGADTNHNLVLVSKGSGAVQFRDGGGNVMGQFNSGSNPVNFLTLQSGSGSTVAMYASGASADVNVSYSSKGIGSHFFRDGSNQSLLVLNSAASAVNYLSVNASAAGSPLYVRATNADAAANTELCLRSNGLGAITLRSGTANALMFTATPLADAVNYISVVSAATLTGPLMTVNGSDTNINLRIQGKGTGIIDALSMISHRTYTTTGRPAANTVPAGTEFFNTTTKKPNYSDGTNWYDAMGNAA